MQFLPYSERDGGLVQELPMGIREICTARRRFGAVCPVGRRTRGIARGWGSGRGGIAWVGVGGMRIEGIACRLWCWLRCLLAVWGVGMGTCGWSGVGVVAVDTFP